MLILFYCSAVAAHAEAVKLCEGVEGRNEKERAAKLRLELHVECAALDEAEDATIETKTYS